MGANNINGMQIIQMIRNGQNPQQLILSMLQSQMGSNPLYQNLYMLAQQNRTGEIEQIARNIYRANGADFDKEFNTFRKNLGL